MAAPGILIVISGPPGAGKTTTARELVQRYAAAVHLHTDDFWGFIASGAVPPFLAAADAQNHTVVEAIVAAAFAYADGGFVVVVDGIVGPWMLQHYRRAMTSRPDVAVHYVVLRPARLVALRRAERRAAGALVDEGPILSLWDQFAELHGLETYVIDTTQQSASETLTATIAAIDSNRFVLRAADPSTRV